MHILLHVFTFNSKSYIRIINTKFTEDYKNEYKNIYKTEVEADLIHIFYNYGDMYDRIISDLNYKKFKQLSFMNISPNLYSVQLHDIKADTNILELFKTYIQLKNSNYLEDNEEDIWHIDFCTKIQDNKNLVKPHFNEKQIYTLCNIEKTIENTYVISKEHLLSLVAFYIDHKYIEMRDSKYKYNTETSELQITKEDRSIYLSKFVLETCDLEKILEFLNIDFNLIKTLKKEANKSSTDNIFTGLYNTHYAPAEFDKTDLYGDDTYYTDNTDLFDNSQSIFSNTPLFNNDYTSVFTKQNGLNDPDLKINKLPEQITAEEIMQKVHNFRTKLEGKYEAKQKPNVASNLYIYTNIITNNINIFDIELMYLSEYKLINFISKLSSKLVSYINDNNTSIEDINEMQQVLAIIKPSSDTSDTTNQQLTLTKLYVDKNKNDQKETLASVVVDNVKNYLSESISTINQNQIGQDLVELGVKKIRKSKGFVYGIEDTSSGNKIDFSNPMPLSDKYLKPSFSIRSEPPNPMIPNVSPFNMSSKIV